MAEPLSPKPDASALTEPDASGAASASGAAGVPGAPIAKDAIDPELVKLRRAAPKVGMVTAAGITGLCLLFWFRLGADRDFAGSGQTPRPVAIGDVLAGKVATEQLISLPAEPLMGHAIRASTKKGNLGLRVAPARGTGDRLWLVISGDGLAPVQELPQYQGRLRRLAELPFATEVADHLAKHPRPVFAAPAAVRAAFATGTLRTVTGDEVTLRDSDEVAVDVVDLEAATVVTSFGDRLPDARAWAARLAEAGILPSADTAPQQATAETARFAVAMSPTQLGQKLEQAGLWAARVEPVLRSLRGTWGKLRTSPAGSLLVGEAALAEVQVDLVGVMVARGLPADAFALVTSEAPADYWYVRPISIALLLFAALFGWIFVRAVRRDLLPVKT